MQQINMTNFSVGVAGDCHHPHVKPNYQRFGLTGLEPSSAEATAIKHIKLLRPELCEQYMKLAQKLVDLGGFRLVRSYMALHYQDKDTQPITVAWLRFERAGKTQLEVGGEHISFTFDVSNGRLMGLVRILAQLDNADFVTHQQALTTAVQFLRIQAPDLLSEDINMPQLTALPKGSRIEFSKEDGGAKLGKLQLHWIDDHTETGAVNGRKFITHGMKMKLFNPEQELYTWVIIDKNAQIQVFERNISWNFAKYQRDTQMWLHDQWLVAQEIRI
jgi:hypothetical protein